MKTPMTAFAVSLLVATAIISAAAISFAAQEAGSKTATSEDVKRETAEAVQAIKNYSLQQRDKAVKKVRIAMKDLDARIDHLQDKLENSWDKMNQASREKARKALKVLREKRNALGEWYGGLKYSSADAWNHVKRGFIESYEALANSFNKAEKEFSSGESTKSGG